MKCLLAIAACLALTAPSEPSEPPDQPKWSNATPPARFNAEGAALVVFVHPGRIAELCSGVGTPPPGLEIVACTIVPERGPVFTIVPHPIFWAQDEYYARLMAHELAHQLTGWRHEAE